MRAALDEVMTKIPLEQATPGIKAAVAECILKAAALQVRKATLASILAKARPGIRFNEHIEGDGPTVFAHACKMGLEDIVSKRKDSAYRCGRSRDWLKMRNPACAAVAREAEEDWAKGR